MGNDNIGQIQTIQNRLKLEFCIFIKTGGGFIQKKNFEGSMARTVAMATIRFSPPESWWVIRSSNFAMPRDARVARAMAHGLFRGFVLV